MSQIQTDLPLFKADKKKPDCAFMLELLKGKDWRTAAELLDAIGLPPTEQNKRSLRAVAEASNGRVAGGQMGYKLVESMSSEEYQHYRNAQRSQARATLRRIIQADKVFYKRIPIVPLV